MFGQRGGKPDGGTDSPRTKGGVQFQHLQCHRFRFLDAPELGERKVGDIVQPVEWTDAERTLRPVDSTLGLAGEGQQEDGLIASAWSKASNAVEWSCSVIEMTNPPSASAVASSRP